MKDGKILLKGLKFKDKKRPDPINTRATAITVNEAAYSQPPPFAECNQPLLEFIIAAPNTIGTDKSEARRVCIPKIRAKPPTTSPNITRYAMIADSPMLSK